MKYLKIKATDSTYIDNENKDSSNCNHYDLKLGNNSNFKYIPFIRFGNLKFNRDKRIKKVVLVLKINNFGLNDYNLDDLFLCTIVEDFYPCEITWNKTPKENLELKSMYKVKYSNNSILIDITDIYKASIYINKKIFGFSIFSKSLNKIICISNDDPDYPYISIEYKDNNPVNNTISKIINEFEEKAFSIKSNDEIFYSKIIKISNFRTATFFMENKGLNNIYVSVEISPDGINFIKDLDEKIVVSKSSSVFVVARFLKYTRLKIINEDANEEAIVDIWFQGQKYNYKIIKEVNIWII